MPKLVLLAKGKARTIEMGQELTIGRGYSNLLRLEGDEISRVHAIIYRRNEDFIVRDLDSKNGVFVNGNRTAYAELGPGDRLQVGKYRMIFDPPSDFDFKNFSDSGLSHTASGSSDGASGGGAHISDTDFSHSQRFSAVTPAKNGAIAELSGEPEICREEVLFYTRQDLQNELTECKSTACQKAADYQDEFFASLIEPDNSSDSLSGFTQFVLCSLAKALRADRGVVIVRDLATNSLSPAAVCAVEEDVAVNSVVLRSGFSEGKAILCPSTQDCGLFRDSGTVARDRISTLVSVPLGWPEVQGLLYIDRQGDADAFNPAHILAAARVARMIEAHIAEINALTRKESS